MGKNKVLASPYAYRPRGASGKMVSELFEHVGGVVDDLCFLQGMHTEGIAHGPATLFLHTGSINLVRPSVGSWVLYAWINPLTMWLTFATFVGYAVIYTVILKPLTPQNIVIGGASGAMPPVLGWAAMTGSLDPGAWILFLIIFLWTPPHFWALALYRVEDYRKAGLPMLPVTHGNEFTRLQVLLYTFILFAACLMPFIYGMSGWLYLAVAVAVSIGFTGYAFALWRNYSDTLARKTFRFSLIHLSVLFLALLVDHYIQ